MIKKMLLIPVLIASAGAGASASYYLRYKEVKALEAKLAQKEQNIVALRNRLKTEAERTDQASKELTELIKRLQKVQEILEQNK